MRRGVRLGVDVGRVRVGLARTDPDGLLAVPVETLARGTATLQAIAAAAAEYDAIEIVVGLPLSLSGADTPSPTDARDLAATLAATIDIPVRLIDERLSTVTAQRGLTASGRSTRQSRQLVDQAAAVIILQHALDRERSSDTPPGTLVIPDGRA